MIPGVNYKIYGYSFATATPGVSLYSKSTLEEKYCCSYYSRYSDRWQFEKKFKNRTLYTYLNLLPTNLNFSIY